MNRKRGFRRIALVSAILVAVIACTWFLAVIIPCFVKVVSTNKTFTTSDHIVIIVVDDFESYNDFDPAHPLSNRIFNVWWDGYGIPINGSLVGYDNPPFCERTIVHSGEQAMPFFYDNTVGAAYSEAELPLSPPQDWTKSGVDALSLWFYGDPNNSAAQIYVKINGSKVVYGRNAGDIAKPQWKQWNIDLASFGAGLRNVTKLGIGIKGSGASGTLYFDDIELYAPAPERSHL